MNSVHFYVSGKVQGVFFRKYTQKQALSLGVVGWVRNVPDGRVEVYAQGTTEALNHLMHWCHHEGSPKAKVTSMDVVKPCEVVGEKETVYTTFFVEEDARL
mmetsp:Transcript_26688/g.37190  ORF Transcript_26688/g.37190 Transcript_26688/m.37190 type:complete len:101 (-) Transcript_26688:9-311(-)